MGLIARGAEDADGDKLADGGLRPSQADDKRRPHYDFVTPSSGPVSIWPIARALASKQSFFKLQQMSNYADECQEGPAIYDDLAPRSSR